MTCKICRENSVLFLKGLFDDRYGYPKAFDIYRCTSCKSFQTEPRLRPEEIGPLYTDYYPRKNIDPKTVENRARSFRPANAFNSWLSGEHRAQRLLPLVSHSNDDASRPKALDVGCGDGFSLLELRSLGYDAYGIETDVNVAKIRDALDLNIHIGTIEDASFPAHSFDYIIANQVIEHVVDLDSFCISIKRSLAPTGTVILSTPNAKSVFRMLYARRWMHWHIPYHQQILSSRGLYALLRRHGLKVVWVRTVSPSSWTMHELNRLRFKADLGKKNQFWTDPQKIHSTLAGKIFRKLAFYGSQGIGKAADLLGHGNCIIVQAVKEREPRDHHI